MRDREMPPKYKKYDQERRIEVQKQQSSSSKLHHATVQLYLEHQKIKDKVKVEDPKVWRAILCRI